MVNKEEYAVKRILSFLLTLALLAVFIPVSAGDGTVYSFGFDFDPIVEGWTFLDGDGDGVGWDWSIGKDAVNKMAGDCMFSESRDLFGDKGDLTPDNWMFSPAVQVPANGATVILYAATQDRTAYHDVFALYAGASPEPGAMERLTNEEGFFPKGDGFYALFGGSLKNYAGKTVYIGIRHFGSTGQSAVCIDEFAVGDFDLPKNPNYPIPIHFDAAGGVAEEETLYGEGPGPLKYLPMASRPGYRFDGWYTGDGTQVFSSKNIFTEETTLHAKWAEGQAWIMGQYGFETDPESDGWLLLDEDGDGNGWGLINSYVVSEANIMQGSSALCSASATKYGDTLTPDNWAISPAVRLPGGKVTLSLSAVAQDGLNCREHFAVYVGATPEPDKMVKASGGADMVTESGDETKVYTVDLTPWAEQTVYIGLRHYNTAGQYMLLIDMLELSADTAHFPLWIAGRQVNADNAGDVLGDGKFAYDPNGQILTVSGDCTCQGIVIESQIEGLTVNVAKDSVLTTTGTTAVVMGGDTTFKGKGALTVAARDIGLYMDEDYGVLTLQGINLDVRAALGITANSTCEMVFFTGCSLSVESTQGAVSGFGNGMMLIGAAVVEPEKALIYNGSILEENGTDLARKVVIDREPVLGDADGDGEITSTDARLTLQLSVGKIGEEEVFNALLLDVDGDGKVTSTDARLILQYAVGKIGEWPMPKG